jgi:3-oxoacyl-[acyl-carrier protein] reductase
LLRFLLSARSAFITGQALALEAASAALAESVWVRPLANKVALVTGAARGIGEATVRRLAAEGAHVVCLDRPEDARATAQVAAANGGSTLDCDVRDRAAPQVIADALRARHGGVDVVVHNAGVTRDKTLQRMSGEQWDEVIDVNLGAVIRIDQALAGVLRERGRVICVASIAGIAGTVGQTNYAAAKAGLIGYVRKRASLFAPRGVTVNAVAPGLIETRLTAAMPIFVREAGRRLSALAQGGEPLDVAEAITFLASPGAAGINGSVLRVCGGAFLGA